MIEMNPGKGFTCNNSFLGRLSCYPCLQQSRGEHACSDGVCQTPRGFGIYYSKQSNRNIENTQLHGSNSRV